MKLISMTDFVLERTTDLLDYGYNRNEVMVNRYAKFLKQPLKLEMFVPCVDGVPIEYYDMPKSGGKYCSVGSEVEKQAKEKVLFEGFKSVYNAIVNQNNGYLDTSLLKGKNIEFLVKTDVILTENALKQIEL